MIRISNIDLIEELKKNSRISYVELAKKLGVSETAVRKKIRKLEQLGIIIKYTVEVDPKKIGYEILAIIGIDTIPEKYFKILEELNKNNKIIKLNQCSGDHMIIIESWFKNSKDLSDFLKTLEGIEGVIKICPAIVNEKIKY